MLYRLASAAIVVFWLVMTLLLVRNEVSPDASHLREVPLAHVLKVLFLHEQPSDLIIYSGNSSVGSIRFQPRLDREADTRGIDISGDLRVQLTPEQKARFNWVGQVEMLPNYEMKRSKWNLSMLEPERIRLELDTPEHAKAAHYVLRTGHDVILSEGDMPLERGSLSGLTKMAGQAGIGADLGGLLPNDHQPTTVRARQSSLKYRGERTETYLITVEQNGQTLLEAHLSQLGQLLTAKTALGYTLRLDNFIP